MLRTTAIRISILTFMLLMPIVWCQAQTTQTSKAEDGITALEEGRLQDAYNLFKEEFEDAAKAGVEDFRLGNAINNLGEVFRRAKRLDDAEASFVRASAIAKKISDPTLEGSAKNNLGLVYLAFKKYDQAITALEEALKIRQKLFGEETVDVAITLDNLGLAYAANKDFIKAEGFTKRSLAIFEKKEGSLGKNTIIATNNLADFYSDQGKIDAAISLHQKIVDLTEAQFGKYSPKLLDPIALLRSMYITKGDSKGIESIFRRNLELLEKNNIAAYPQKVYVLAILGYELGKQKKNAEAEEFLKRAFDGIDVEMAKKSGRVADIAITFYINFLRDNDREKEAALLEEKVKKMFGN